MAINQQRHLFKKLKKLFSTGVIVRQVGGTKLSVMDADHVQSHLSNAFKDRYTRLFSTAGLGNTWGNQYGLNMAYQTQRIMLFREYDIMDQDPILNAALDIYADEATVANEFGEILTIESENGNVKDILKNLFYDIINIEFNLAPWIRGMAKYGDHFLFIEIADKYGVINVQPMSVYDTMRIEGDDPANPRYTYFQTLGMNGQKTKLEAYEILHFRLMSDSNFLPYGRSMLEGARRTWKQLMLMEDAMLIHRIMRAPEKRIFKIDIGNMKPNEVDAYMQMISDKMKKVPFQDNTTGEYNLRYNMMNILEDFYIPVRGGDSGTEISNLSGLEFNAIEDIEYLKNRMMAALKIPKAFLGYDDAISGKLTLAAEDVRFSRTIERIQKIIVSELTKLAVVHLYAQGFTDSDLVNFSLKLTLPSTIYEQEKLNLWTEKVRVASDMKQLKMLSTSWIYKNVFNLSEDEMQEQLVLVVDDIKREFRFAQLEAGEPDPVKYGFPQDQDISQEPDSSNFDDGGGEGMAQERVNPVGRPREGNKYAKDSHPRGRDPLGFKERYHSIRHSHTDNRHSQGKSPLSIESMIHDSQLSMDKLVTNFLLESHDLSQEVFESPEGRGNPESFLNEEMLEMGIEHNIDDFYMDDIEDIS